MRNPIPRVAAIHDLAGFARTSLTAAIPILSSMGIQATPLPTAILSTQTVGYNDFTLLDLTDDMTDKNGNSIFEHDLILIHESESSYQFTVEVLFHKGMFCYKNKACGFTPLWYVSDRCEVIGNAFDNPELMKEGVQP